jgi:hypothetical protein
MTKDLDRGSVKSSTLIAYVLPSQLGHRYLADDHLKDNYVMDASDDVTPGPTRFSAPLKASSLYSGSSECHSLSIIAYVSDVFLGKLYRLSATNRRFL